MHEPILLTPGPTGVPPAVREALARPMIHHRTEEFQAILRQVQENLKRLFRTASDVLILTSSGTGAMEAAVANLLSPGEEALVILGGKFGQRWAEICQAYGVQQILIDPVWGQPLDLNRIEKAFKEHPKIKVVFSTLCETSTGVVYPIREIRKAMEKSEALLVVDAISGLGSEEFAMDEWRVDVTICGSQKGLMLPPGLAFIALSDRAWISVERSSSSRYYLDLRKTKAAWEKTDTPFTPGISLIVGLSESLKFILKEGLGRFIQRHQVQAQEIRKSIQAMGLELYADPSCASTTATSVKVPAGIDGKELLKRIRKEYGIFIAGGQGKELSGKIFRIASMGAVGPKEIQAGLSALEKVLSQMGFNIQHVTTGGGRG